MARVRYITLEWILVWAALWNFQRQAWAGWELSILSWMVLLRPLRLLQRLGEPLSILLHKHTLCTKTDRGSSSLCSSLRGLNSTIQLRIDSYQPAQACPWKFHNPVYTNPQSRAQWDITSGSSCPGIFKCRDSWLPVFFLSFPSTFSRWSLIVITWHLLLFEQHYTEQPHLPTYTLD